MLVHEQFIKVLRGNLRRALRASRLEPARDLLDKLKQEDPLAVETRGLELEYLFACKRHADAANLATQLVRLFPDSARIQFWCGRSCYQRKDYAAALQHFTESERLYASWLTRRWLGKTHSQLGQLAEAEALLLELLPDHPAVALDLAWVCERKDDLQHALEYVERYLARQPGDNFALAQRLRLRARTLEPQDLATEVQSLLEFGEEVAPEIFTAHIQRLLETGQGEEARSAIAEYEPQLDARSAASLAWVCHHLRAFDLAVRLFLRGLPAHLSNVKYLSALEADAVRCARVDELIECYQAHAEQERRLYGRIKTLEKRR